MGDVGVATSPDAMSQRWNPAKHIFAAQSYGVSASYTPWLNKISKGMNLGLISGFMRKERYAIGASATYLSIGGIDLYSSDGTPTGSISSDEFAFDASYSHRLGERFSGGITLRYANAVKVESSGMPNGAALRPSPAFAGDVSFFYTSPIEAFGRESNISLGTSISNLGTKVKLSREIFLPMKWALGTTWSTFIDSKNDLAVSLDFNKSLVPINSDVVDYTVIEAIGKSFGNSRDFVWSTGVEYTYMKMAMLRAGYSNSKNEKRFRYFTLGAGLVYQSIKIDASYLLGTSSISTPLANTFRISLSYFWN